MRSALAALAVAAILATSPARADAPDRGVAIGVAIGPHLPAGNVGVIAEYAVLPWLAIEGGVGRNLGAYRKDGNQYALMLRVRTPGVLRAFAGVGASAGYEHQSTEDDVCRSSPRGCKDVADGTAVWTNLELGLEVELEHSFARIYGGPRFLDNPGHVCVEPEDPWQPCHSFVYFGVAVGARW